MQKRKIGFDDLEDAASRGIIDKKQAAQLWELLAERGAGVWSLSIVNVMIGILAGLALLSFAVYAGLKIEYLTPLHVFGIAAALWLASLWFADYAARSGALVIASAMATIAVALTPLAVFALQMHLGSWPFTIQDAAAASRAAQRGLRDFHQFVDTRWLVMEMATIGVAAAVIAWRKFTLPMMPICIVLWYMVMDYSMYSDLHQREMNFREIYQWNSVYFGLAALIVAVGVDHLNESQQDYGFWVYVAGVVSFWGGLVMMDSSGEWAKFQFACINLVLCLGAGYLQRWPLALFGGAGLVLYYQHLVTETFKDHDAFWLVSGISAIALLALLTWGIRHREAIQEFFLQFAPESVRRRARVAEM